MRTFQFLGGRGGKRGPAGRAARPGTLPLQLAGGPGVGGDGATGGTPRSSSGRLRAAAEKTRAHTLGTVASVVGRRAGGERAHIYIYYIIIIIIIAAVEHTHTYIINIRGSRRSHVYTYYTYTVVGCVPRVRSRGGVDDNGRVCVRMGGARCVWRGEWRKYELARAHTYARRAR